MIILYRFIVSNHSDSDSLWREGDWGRVADAACEATATSAAASPSNADGGRPADVNWNPE
jgi:hypothetical protein